MAPLTAQLVPALTNATVLAALVGLIGGVVMHFVGRWGKRSDSLAEFRTQADIERIRSGDALFDRYERRLGELERRADESRAAQVSAEDRARDMEAALDQCRAAAEELSRARVSAERQAAATEHQAVEFYLVLCHVEREVGEIREQLREMADPRGAALLELAVQTLERVRRGKELREAS